MPETLNPIRILAVEDNPADARILAELFRELGVRDFRLSVAESLAMASGLRQSRPELLLLDLNLPDSMGAATLDRASDLFPGVPVIVMTGLDEAELGTALIKKGAQDYLTKGRLTPESLAYSIRYSIERAKIYAEMREKERQLRDILEKCPDGFLVVAQNNQVVFANCGAEAIFGRRAAELLKQPFTLEADCARILEDEVRRPDGKKLPVEVRAVTTLWNGEECRLVILRDLNPVRALQRSRDEFISMVSHELRSPLTVVKESLLLLADGTCGEPAEAQKELLRIGIDNAARLNRLIDGLLDITKIEAGMMPMEIVAADLGRLVEDTARDYALLAGDRKIRVEKDLPPERLTTYCDLEKIRQVLVNLVSNAIKFTPDGGAIVLSLRALSGTAVLSVQNSGPGMDEGDLARLFQKFARIGSRNFSSVKGTGLGLAISKGIMELHRGQIWAESQPQKGTCFHLRLPLIGAAEALREAVRREIDLSGASQRGFCAVTFRCREEEAGAIETFLKNHMRSARTTIRLRAGTYAMLIPDCDAANGARAAAALERCASGLAERGQGKASALVYPQDFDSESSFMEKWAAAA